MSKDLAEARKRYDDDNHYMEKLEEGLQFQDVVTRALYQLGIVIVGYASRRFQNMHGENILGAEIKRDGKFRRTNKLYIEVYEKSHPNNPEFIRSGIMREDNSWLFVIGDESTIWIFSTKWLRKMHKRWERVQTPTSIGHLMPIDDADKWCIRRIDLEPVECVPNRSAYDEQSATLSESPYE